jgi:NitT/TauT family transport system substrate-binding protein
MPSYASRHVRWPAGSRRETSASPTFKTEKAMKHGCAFLVCLGLFSAALAPSALAEENLDKVDFRLDWSLTGYHLPFYWAAKKGYYREEGLDVDIKPGAGSQQTINLVAGEHDEIGFADYSLMAASVAKGMKVKAIFGVVQSDAWAIYSYLDTPIRKPADLVGKSVVLVVDHKPMIDLLMKLNGIDPAAVQLRLVNPATRGTVFAQHAADGILAISIGSANSMGGSETTSMLLSAYGVNLLGQGLIASESFLAKRPDVARRFIKATSRAFRETVIDTNIEEALTIAHQMSGTTTKAVEDSREEWKNTIPRLVSKNAPGKPVGWMSEIDWRDTMKILREMGRVNSDIGLGQLYTNEFIPAN